MLELHPFRPQCHQCTNERLLYPRKPPRRLFTMDAPMYKLSTSLPTVRDRCVLLRIDFDARCVNFLLCAFVVVVVVVIALSGFSSRKGPSFAFRSHLQKTASRC